MIVANVVTVLTILVSLISLFKTGVLLVSKLLCNYLNYILPARCFKIRIHKLSHGNISPVKNRRKESSYQAEVIGYTATLVPINILD